MGAHRRKCDWCGSGTPIVRDMELQAPATPAAGGKPPSAEHSLPQMHSAGPIERQLQRWWSQRK